VSLLSQQTARQNTYVPKNMNDNGVVGMGGFKTSALCLCLV